MNMVRQDLARKCLRAFVLALAGWTFSPAALKAQSRQPDLPLERHARPVAELRAHGVEPNPRDLIKFLEEGLPKGHPMPKEPAEKCQLVINAMAQLAEAKSKEAVSVLHKIASLKPPAGVQQLLEYDVNLTSPETRQAFRNQALKLMQYNAVNALSLIGESSSSSVMRSVYQAEQEVGARIQYAVCLASVGDPTGVDYLVQVIQQANRRESAAAARAFVIITGQDFGYTENTPVRARRTRSQLYAQWWQGNRGSFRVDREAVLERRANPIAQAAYEPRTTRDLLKLACNYFDFRNSTKSYEARRALSEAGGSLNKELERIAVDDNEDLNVRMEAMNWFYEANRITSKTLFKKLRRNENPEIADKANTLLEQIAENETKPATARIGMQ